MPTRNRQSGFVLLVTLIMIIAITGIILSYSQSVRIFHNYTTSEISDTNLRNAAQSGLQYALAYLNSGKEPAGISIHNIALDDINCEITIECENGRININNLVNASDEYDQYYCELLMRVIDIYNQNPDNPRMSYAIIAAAVDAIDRNSTISEISLANEISKGAEKSYYRDQDLPLPLDKPFGRASDLAFVKGVEADQLNSILEPAGRSFLNCLTASEHKKIDINSAPAEVILALAPELDLAAARQLQADVQNRKYSTLEEFYTAAAIDSETNALDAILETEPTKRTYLLTISVSNSYKTIKLTAKAKTDDSNMSYYAQEMYCN